jgi:N-acetylneuraminic acid mutarotase
MKSVIRLSIVLVVLQAFSGVDLPQKQSSLGTWKMMPQVAPVKFRGTIGAVLAGNKLVIWGGEIGGDTNEQPASDGAVYDIDRNTWKKMAPAPIEGREHFTMIEYGPNVLIWGGEDNPHGAIYDVDNDAWRKIADAPLTLGMEPYTSGIIGDKLLVWGIGKTRDLNPVGGIYDLTRNAWREMASLTSLKAIDGWPPLFYKNTFSVWGCPTDEKTGRHGAVYDLVRNEWREMAVAPIERRNWPAAALINGKLIVWGGCDGPVEAHTGTSRADGAVYNIEKDTWTKMSSAPLEARWAPRSFAWGGKTVIWGGMGKAGNEDNFFYYDGAVYDPETDTWEKISEAPVASGNAKKIYSYGIFGYNPTPPTLYGNKLVVWSMHCRAVYDLDKKRWEEMPSCPIGGRDYHQSFLYGNKLVIWGGRDEKSSHSNGAVFEFSR